MLGSLRQLVYCLWCIPAIAAFLVGMFLWRRANLRTHTGALPPGVDPLSPEGQKHFETTRGRDKEKKKVLLWCVVGAIAVYAVALIATSSPVKVLAAGKTATPTVTETATITITLEPSQTPRWTGTPGATATWQPTATDRVVYRDRTVNVPGPVQVVTVMVPQPFVITQVVTVEVTRVVTATFTPTPTATCTPTATETP